MPSHAAHAVVHAASDAIVWPELTTTQETLIWAVPIGSFVLMVLVLGWLWPVTTLKSSRGNDLEAQAKSQAGAAQESSSLMSGSGGDSSSSYGAAEQPTAQVSNTLLPGQVAGDYDEAWTSTFDFAFFLFMIACLVCLLGATTWLRPTLFHNTTFWMYQIPKLVIMFGVSGIGGLICRYFCEVDERGYIVTNVSSWFKVNYTRKLQHFAAYAVPLFVTTPASCACSGALEEAWGYWFTLIGFLVLIKPVRESSSLFMMQFNSLDRPEDRPHTLKWILVGNIIPGIFCIIFFRSLFAQTAQTNLVFIFVFITSIGDGLAEPVGITVGRHKYRTSSCFSSRKYTRSYEGSACVALSALVFTALQYADFANATQFWACMIVLPPAMAYAEATSPHTMDTPFLMGLGGALIYLFIHVF